MFPRTLHMASAKKLSSLTGKLDSRNSRTSTATEDKEKGHDRLLEASIIDRNGPKSNSALEAAASSVAEGSDGYFMLELPGDKPDFWEGPQWDALGFFV